MNKLLISHLNIKVFLEVANSSKVEPNKVNVVNARFHKPFTVNFYTFLSCILSIFSQFFHP